MLLTLHFFQLKLFTLLIIYCTVSENLSLNLNFSFDLLTLKILNHYVSLILIIHFVKFLYFIKLIIFTFLRMPNLLRVIFSFKLFVIQEYISNF